MPTPLPGTTLRVGDLSNLHRAAGEIREILCQLNEDPNVDMHTMQLRLQGEAEKLLNQFPVPLGLKALCWERSWKPRPAEDLWPQPPTGQPRCLSLVDGHDLRTWTDPREALDAWSDDNHIGFKSGGSLLPTMVLGEWIFVGLLLAIATSFARIALDSSADNSTLQKAGVRGTFLPVPPQYNLAGSDIQRRVVPLIYGIMHCNLCLLGMLPVLLTRGLWDFLCRRFPTTRRWMPMHDLVALHKRCGYLLLAGLITAALLWLGAMGWECLMDVGLGVETKDGRLTPQSCLAFLPDVQDFFSTVQNVLFLRELVWPLVFGGMPLIALRAAPRCFQLQPQGEGPLLRLRAALRHALDHFWWEVALTVHVLGFLIVLTMALQARFDVFWPVLFGWVPYFLDRVRERCQAQSCTICVQKSVAQHRVTKAGQRPIQTKLVMSVDRGSPGHRAGQYYFLSIDAVDGWLRHSLSGYWHPFSISCEEKANELVFNIAAQGTAAFQVNDKVSIEWGPDRTAMVQRRRRRLPEGRKFACCLRRSPATAQAAPDSTSEDVGWRHQVRSGTLGRATGAEMRVAKLDGPKCCVGDGTACFINPGLTWTYQLWNHLWALDPGLPEPLRLQPLGSNVRAQILGPYGGLHLTCFGCPAVLLIGSGTGVTSVLSLLKETLRRQVVNRSSQAPPTCLIWQCAHEDNLLWCWEDLVHALACFLVSKRRACPDASATAALGQWLTIKIFVSSTERMSNLQELLTSLRPDPPAFSPGASRATGSAPLGDKASLRGAGSTIDATECLICLSPIVGDTLQTPCSHTFHKGCLRTWCEENTVCPSCRQCVYIGECTPNFMLEGLLKQVLAKSEAASDASDDQEPGASCEDAGCVGGLHVRAHEGSALAQACLDVYKWLVQVDMVSAAGDRPSDSDDPPYVCSGSFMAHAESVLRCSRFMLRVHGLLKPTKGTLGVCYCGNQAIGRVVRLVTTALEGLQVELAMETSSA